MVAAEPREAALRAAGPGEEALPAGAAAAEGLLVAEAAAGGRPAVWRGVVGRVGAAAEAVVAWAADPGIGPDPLVRNSLLRREGWRTAGQRGRRAEQRLQGRHCRGGGPTRHAVGPHHGVAGQLPTGDELPQRVDGIRTGRLATVVEMELLLRRQRRGCPHESRGLLRLLGTRYFCGAANCSDQRPSNSLVGGSRPARCTPSEKRTRA